MTGRHGDKDQANKSSAILKAEDILAWLKANPDFLDRNPDAVHYLVPQAEGNIIDFRSALLKKAQNDLSRTAHERETLVSISRDNLIAQAQVHSAVLSMLEARSFEALIHAITHEWPALLSADWIAIGVESELALDATMPNPHLFLLAPGSVDLILSRGSALLRKEPQGDEELLFGPQGAQAKSSALIRLDMGKDMPKGLLVLGSRKAGKFDPRQATDLLEFLGQTLARVIRSWLGQKI